MNKFFGNKIKMYRSVIEVWDKNRGLWEKIPMLVKIYDEIVNLVANIDAVAPEVSTTTSGMTNDKNADRVLLAGMLFTVSSALYAFADRTQNGELKN